MSNDNTIHPRFFKMRRDWSKSQEQDIKDNIIAYWNASSAHLVNGVPEIAFNDNTYQHKDIVRMRWNGKKLELVK